MFKITVPPWAASKVKREPMDTESRLHKPGSFNAVGSMSSRHNTSDSIHDLPWSNGPGIKDASASKHIRYSSSSNEVIGPNRHISSRGAPEAIQVTDHKPAILKRTHRYHEAYKAERDRPDALKGKNHHAQEEIASLRERCTSLQRELKACKDDLFSRQPPNQITDTEIADKFEQLSQQISHWTDQAFASIDYFLDVKDSFPLAKSADQVTDEILTSIPSAAEFLMRHIIFRHLQEKILNDEVYLATIQPIVASSLKTIEESIKMSKDKLAGDRWRSETLTAMATTQRFSRGKDGFIRLVTEQLREALLESFPILKQLKEIFAKLEEHIVSPTVELAIVMQTSLTRYKLYPQMDFPPLWYLPTRHPELIPGCVLKDIETRRILTPQSSVTKDQDGTIGHDIMVIEPQLMRYESDLYTEVVLRKAQAVIKLDVPLDARGRRDNEA